MTILKQLANAIWLTNNFHEKIQNLFFMGQLFTNLINTKKYSGNVLCPAHLLPALSTKHSYLT